MNLEYLKSIINNRTVCLMSHGASIRELEHHIIDFDGKNVCWVSLGLFPIMEEFILSRINKKLDIVFDCATVPEARMPHYEPIRLRRIHHFLTRANSNLWITTHGLLRDSVTPYYPHLLEHDCYKNRILQVDSLFPADDIAKWMDVPNSMTLLIGAMIAGGASKIMIFGLDGYNNDISKGIHSYYHPEAHINERIAALGTTHDAGINRDTNGFEIRFPNILKGYFELFQREIPIYNCSPNSLYSVLPKITYGELNGLL